MVLLRNCSARICSFITVHHDEWVEMISRDMKELLHVLHIHTHTYIHTLMFLRAFSRKRSAWNSYISGVSCVCAEVQPYKEMLTFCQVVNLSLLSSSAILSSVQLCAACVCSVRLTPKKLAALLLQFQRLKTFPISSRREQCWYFLHSECWDRLQNVNLD